MRFTSIPDFNTVQLIQQELVNIIVDTPVILYKLNQRLTKTNTYDEAPDRVYYNGVLIPCLYERAERQVIDGPQTIDTAQAANFRFLRYECQIRNIYPEIGDVIFFDQQYYEIERTVENQLWAGQDLEIDSIICYSHATSRVITEIEPPDAMQPEADA